MLLAFWIVIPVLVYLFAIGFSWKQMQLSFIRRCSHCELNDGKWEHYGYHGLKIVGYGEQWNDSFHMHSESGALALLWPIMLPVLLGQTLSNRNSVKLDKDEQRRQNELTEKKHQLEIAKLQTQEDALLDKRLAQLERQDR